MKLRQFMTLALSLFCSLLVAERRAAHCRWNAWSGHSKMEIGQSIAIEEEGVNKKVVIHRSGGYRTILYFYSGGRWKPVAGDESGIPSTEEEIARANGLASRSSSASGSAGPSREGRNATRDASPSAELKIGQSVAIEEEGVNKKVVVRRSGGYRTVLYFYSGGRWKPVAGDESGIPSTKEEIARANELGEN